MLRNEDSIMTEIYQLFETTGYKTLNKIIAEKKEQVGISDYQMSKILGFDKSTFNRLSKKIDEGKLEDVDFYSILKICQFLGIGIEEMSQIYVASLSPELVKQLEYARKAKFILSYFELKALKDNDFIDNVQDFELIEKRIIEFFQLNSLFDYNNEVGGVLFSRTKNLSSDKIREFWVRCAIFQFEKIENPNTYEKEKLLAIIPKIRPYTRFEEKGFLTVLQALYNIGITVIVQKYLSKTQVRGGTFFINNKPCIVITDYNKTYATLWFALLHELYHCLYDLDDLNALKYHLTGEQQSDLYLFREEYADYFACEMLFPQKKLDYIKHMIQSSALVNDYAEKNKVHPSIIYSFYCYEQKAKYNKDYYPYYSQYFGKSEKALQAVKTNPLNKKTIFEEIEKIKKILTLTNAQ